MKVEIRYRDNRLDVFDTASFTKADPFDGKNMLTNFELRIDALGNTGLWLTAHFYDAAEPYAKKTSEGETPVARRKRGWRFLLAEAGELESAESVSIDGKPVLLRVAGELIDMIRFERMCSIWLTASPGTPVAKQAVQLFDELCRAYPEDAADGERVARLCGFSLSAINELRERIATSKKVEEEGEWITGLEG